MILEQVSNFDWAPILGSGGGIAAICTVIWKVGVRALRHYDEQNKRVYEQTDRVLDTLVAATQESRESREAFLEATRNLNAATQELLRLSATLSRV